MFELLVSWDFVCFSDCIFLFQRFSSGTCKWALHLSASSSGWASCSSSADSSRLRHGARRLGFVPELTALCSGEDQAARINIGRQPPSFKLTDTTYYAAHYISWSLAKLLPVMRRYVPMAISCGMHNIRAAAAVRLLLSGFPIFLHARGSWPHPTDFTAFIFYIFFKKQKKPKKKPRAFIAVLYQLKYWMFNVLGLSWLNITWSEWERL